MGNEIKKGKGEDMECNDCIQFIDWDGEYTAAARRRCVAAHNSWRRAKMDEAIASSICIAR